MRLKTTLPVAALAGLWLFGLSCAVHAETHRVAPAGVKFDPMILYVEPGDRVAWINMFGHNVETLDDMVPAGQKKIKSELSKQVVETFEDEGIIVYKCTPHWSSRMGGIVVVGSPGDAAQIIERYYAAIEEDKSYLPAKGLLKKLERDLEQKGLLAQR